MTDKEARKQNVGGESTGIYLVERRRNSLSRIGNMPITVPAGVTVTIGANNEVTVKGP